MTSHELVGASIILLHTHPDTGILQLCKVLVHPVLPTRSMDGHAEGQVEILYTFSFLLGLVNCLGN